MQQDAQRAFLIGEGSHDDEVIEERDELDELFKRLPQLQPPPQIIQQILNSACQLRSPPSQKTAAPEAINEEDALDSLIKHNEHLPPS